MPVQKKVSRYRYLVVFWYIQKQVKQRSLYLLLPITTEKDEQVFKEHGKQKVFKNSHLFKG